MKEDRIAIRKRERKQLRPDTGDARSLPCVRCGVRTPDASFIDGVPVCDRCDSAPATEED